VAALAAAGTALVRVTEPEPDLARLAKAVAEGRPAVLAAGEDGPDDAASRSRAAACLARAAVHLLGRCRPDLVVVTGGETLRALVAALGAGRIHVAGAPLDGLALGEVAMPGGASPPLLTKAGGFGPPGLLLDLVKGQP
jgi:uncharacterized protein YgbK (DUF1537 family)